MHALGVPIRQTPIPKPLPHEPGPPVREAFQELRHALRLDPAPQPRHGTPLTRRQLREVSTVHFLEQRPHVEQRNHALYAARLPFIRAPLGRIQAGMKLSQPALHLLLKRAEARQRVPLPLLHTRKPCIQSHRTSYKRRSPRTRMTSRRFSGSPPSVPGRGAVCPRPETSKLESKQSRSEPASRSCLRTVKNTSCARAALALTLFSKLYCTTPSRTPHSQLVPRKGRSSVCPSRMMEGSAPASRMAATVSQTRWMRGTAPRSNCST